MMFDVKKTTIKKDKSYKYLLYENDRQLSYSDFINLIQQQSKNFRHFFIDQLAHVPFRAYHWETPPVTKQSIDQGFEFVVSRTPGIDLPPDPSPFQQYFEYHKDTVVFNNLGGDAKLIAPVPNQDHQNYSHIGTFTANADREKQSTFWKTVGKVTQDLISDQPIWLNTAGGGVAWLHVRLDSTPKYYRHHPYISKE